MPFLSAKELAQIRRNLISQLSLMKGIDLRGMSKAKRCKLDVVEWSKIQELHQVNKQLRNYQ